MDGFLFFLSFGPEFLRFLRTETHFRVSSMIIDIGKMGKPLDRAELKNFL